MARTLSKSVMQAYMSLFRDNSQGVRRVIFLTLITILLGCSGCAHFRTVSTAEPPNPDILVAGDRIKVETFSQPQDITNECDIWDGSITLPYIGKLTAAGITTAQLGREIADAYVSVFVDRKRDVKVSIVSRYYFIGGCISLAGSNRCLYRGPTSVLHSGVELFTAPGDSRHVKIFRAGTGKVETEDCVKALNNPVLDLPVYPGDVIYMPSAVNRHWWQRPFLP